MIRPMLDYDTYDVERARAAQAAYVSKFDTVPHFAPKSGVCFCCSKQIYKRISVEKASTELITGCPWCSRSYCD